MVPPPPGLGSVGEWEVIEAALAVGVRGGLDFKIDYELGPDFN
jgi:hypothetical protein